MYIQSIHLSTGNSFSDKTNISQYHPNMYVHCPTCTLLVIRWLRDRAMLARWLYSERWGQAARD
jgi:hypothetical protein